MQLTLEIPDKYLARPLDVATERANAHAVYRLVRLAYTEHEIARLQAEYDKQGTWTGD